MGDAIYTNKAIAAGYLPIADAMGKMGIRIAREEFSNVVSPEVAIQGNLIHEGAHALAMAGVLNSMANSSSSIFVDKSRYNDEIDAKVLATKYAIDRGGVFLKHGQAAGFIDASGNMNMTAINSAAERFRGETISGFQRSKGVYKK